MIDSILVGSGLATLSYAKELLANGKSFVVVADDSQQSSRVAGALYNPVILKRFTPVWKAAEQLQVMHDGLNFWEQRYRTNFDESLPVIRKFASIEEQNMWFEASDKPGLSPYLSTKLVTNAYQSIDAPLGFGLVQHTGKVKVSELLDAFQKEMETKNTFINETFDFDSFTMNNDCVVYKDMQAKHIVFCEGYGIQQNPLFNYLPLRGTKGELLVIKAPDLKVTEVVKSACFIIPLGNDLYKIGATYHHDHKNNEPSKEAREELVQKLETLITCPYEIVDQLAGVRPTVADRRPLIGEHPQYKNVFVLNGLGTRGIMIGPYVASILYKAIHEEGEIPDEINSNRFIKRWQKQQRS